MQYTSTVQPKAGRSKNIYYFAKYACFIHRPALGWTVTEHFFPDMKTRVRERQHKGAGKTE